MCSSVAKVNRMNVQKRTKRVKVIQTMSGRLESEPS